MLFVAQIDTKNPQEHFYRSVDPEEVARALSVGIVFIQ
jgi:hypothetical protein